jgi:hypothetical protein
MTRRKSKKYTTWRDHIQKNWQNPQNFIFKLNPKDHMQQNIKKRKQQRAMRKRRR